jgi:hypothetical protein
MAHIFHGDWTRYIPGTLPEGVPSGALFARRTTDSVDWYDYVNAGTYFGSGSAIFTAYWYEPQNSLAVGSATRDPTMLFPAEQAVWEIPNYSGDPLALNNKLYDPTTETFTDPVPVDDPLADIRRRLDALEHGGK